MENKGVALLYTHSTTMYMYMANCPISCDIEWLDEQVILG